MLHRDRAPTALRPAAERGAIRRAPLIALSALLLVGAGAVLYVNAMSQDTPVVEVPKTGVRKAESVQKRPAQEPKRAINIPRVTQDADEVMKGSVIKYRDAIGMTRYKSKDIFEGFTADGRPLYWTVESRVYAGKGKQLSAKKTVLGRKNARKIDAVPTLKFENGKLVAADPNDPVAAEALTPAVKGKKGAAATDEDG